MDGWMDGYMYVPDVSCPLLGAVTPKVPNIQKCWLLKSEYLENGTVSCSVICQLGLNISWTRPF